MKKIVLIGPESTGKTTMSELLAAKYDEPWAEEYAREYIENLNREYQQKDLVEIAKGQLLIEDRQLKKANKFLFCDTDLLVIKLWSEHVYANCDQWIEAQIARRPYDFYFLCKNDFPWEYDPLRENPESGNYFFERFEMTLHELNKPYIILSGDIQGRLKQASEILDEMIK